MPQEFPEREIPAATVFQDKVSSCAWALLLQKTLDDFSYGLLLGKSQGTELGDLFSGDFADSGLMNQGSVNMARIESGGSIDDTASHQNGTRNGRCSGSSRG